MAAFFGALRGRAGIARSPRRHYILWDHGLEPDPGHSRFLGHDFYRRSGIHDDCPASAARFLGVLEPRESGTARRRGLAGLDDRRIDRGEVDVASAGIHFWRG